MVTLPITYSLARLAINGRTLVASVPNINFDSTLGCVDTILPIGWQRLHIDYAGVPEQTVRSFIVCLACLWQTSRWRSQITACSHAPYAGRSANMPLTVFL